MKPVPSCPGYFADEHGNIWRNGTRRKFQDNGHGYLKLKVSVNNKQWDQYAHRMICEAYHGPCPEGLECRHLDGNRQNNAPSNLEWTDKLTNESDKKRHGTLTVGSFNGQATLTADIVVEMRVLASRGTPICAIAEMYGINRGTVGDAVCGRRWGHIPGALPPGSTRIRGADGKWKAKSPVSVSYPYQEPEKWSERLDSNQRPLSPQESADG